MGHRLGSPATATEADKSFAANIFHCDLVSDFAVARAGASTHSRRRQTIPCRTNGWNHCTCKLGHFADRGAFVGITKPGVCVCVVVVSFHLHKMQKEPLFLTTKVSRNTLSHFTPSRQNGLHVPPKTRSFHKTDNRDSWIKRVLLKEKLGLVRAQTHWNRNGIVCLRFPCRGKMF